MNINKWINKNTTSLNNKLICLTGSTGDINKEVCFILAKLGANLLFINRNENKTLKLKKEILDKYPNTKIDYIIMDLNNFESIKKEEYKLKGYNIDVFIASAGIYKVKKETSSIGYNNTFTVNFISHYYLINKVIENGCKKIVAISSIAHNFSNIDCNDFDFSNKNKCSKIYGNSKRFLMSSLYSLNKENSNFKLSIVHPGITFTNMTSHFPKIIYYLIKYPMKLIFISRKKAALNIIKGIYDDCDYLEWIGPKYFDIWGYPNKTKLKTIPEYEMKVISSKSKEIYNQLKKF